MEQYSRVLFVSIFYDDEIGVVPLHPANLPTKNYACFV